MNRIERVATTLTLVLLGAVLSVPRLEAQREPGGHTLRDPSSRIADRAPSAPGADRADVADTVPTPPPPLKLVFTPTVSGDESTTRLGTQLKVRRGGPIPLSFAVAHQSIVTHNNRRNRIKASTEIDLINNRPVLSGLPVFLAALGEVSHTEESGTFAEAAGELDVTVFEKGTSSLAVGVLGYFDHFAPVDGESDSGFTPAVEALWVISSLFELDAEYDFNSSFNGEDSFSARLVVTPPDLPGNPVLILGGAKHGTFTVGVSFSGPLR